MQFLFRQTHRQMPIVLAKRKLPIDEITAQVITYSKKLNT